ncbi:unnamed protein product [Heligmosomoides polygyrus]|uniref:Tectonin beta-propeller repeat-containing protein n=1 Tax=Heligmosomoides polygyrus TaxID=6339 RepID=A0A3P8CDK3_HELPZ|nr:unnamed protein product [Heligmosomoides polygyrus]
MQEITSITAVSNILEDALSRVNLREDLGVLLQNVVDVVDPVQDDYSFQRRGDSKPSLLVPLPDPGIEVTEDLQSPVSVVRKEKGKVAPRRRIQSSSAEGTIQTDQSQPIAIDESTLISLRRHVLGDAIVSGSPCGSGFSFSSTPSLGGSPRNVDIHPKLSDCDGSAVKPSSSGESSEASRPSSPDLDVSKEGVPDYLPTEQALSFARHDRWEEPFGSKEESVQGAESVDCAYEYLLRQNRAPAPSNRFAEAVKITQPTLLENTSRTVNFERSRRHVVLNDRVDIWFRVSMPYTVKSFAVGGSHLAVCHRKKSPRLISLEDLDAKNPVWQTAKWSADCVSMSDDESIIWTVRRNVGFCSIDPLSATMRFTECATDGGGILDVAVGASVAWYTTMEGVSLQMELPDKAIFSKVDRDWPLISISVSVEAVWAIRTDTGNLVVRVGLARCKMGLDWVEIVPEGPSRLVSVCVVRSYGFALDDAGQLWMTTGVDQQHPYGSSDAFFKNHGNVKFLAIFICIDLLCTCWCTGFRLLNIKPIKSEYFRVSSAGLFLCVGKLMYISRSAISGHKFPREILGKYEMLDNFSVISAGSFDGSVGLFLVGVPLSAEFGSVRLSPIETQLHYFEHADKFMCG